MSRQIPKPQLRTTAAYMSIHAFSRCRSSPVSFLKLAGSSKLGGASAELTRAVTLETAVFSLASRVPNGYLCFASLFGEHWNKYITRWKTVCRFSLKKCNPHGSVGEWNLSIALTNPRSNGEPAAALQMFQAVKSRVDDDQHSSNYMLTQ